MAECSTIEAHPPNKNYDSGSRSRAIDCIHTHDEGSDLSSEGSKDEQTKETLASSPIKYVLSYMWGNKQFRTQTVKDLESLDPTYSHHQTQEEGKILEVVRTAYIEPLIVDHTRPLASQQTTISQYGTYELKINSSAINQALSSVVKYWPELNLNSPSLVIEEPFAVLYKHKEALQEYAAAYASSLVQNEGERCRRKRNTDTHMKLLFDFLDKRPEARKIHLEHERHHRSTPVATFEMLWLLFSPGTDVFHDPDASGSFSGFVVKSSGYEHLESDDTEPFTITLWYLDYNGYQIGRVEECASIQPFKGEREISNLPVIPCDFHERNTAGQISDKSRSLRKSLEDEGETFLKLVKHQCVEYSGETSTFPRRQITGRVIVDMEGYYEEYSSSKPDLEKLEDDGLIMMPPCSCSYCDSHKSTDDESTRRSQFSQYDGLRPEASDFTGLTSHQMFLCTRRIFGYALNLRSWQALQVTHIKECRWKNTMIDNQLTMDNGDRDMIKGLVQRYNTKPSQENPSGEQWRADFIAEKSESQIFLLHGKPGVGKTFTAECVAEFVQRPIFSLNCTDIGVDATVVEIHLKKFAKMAKRWGAVLLLDEADVYLEQRTSHDLKRNCLVAAFLRCLEYFQGLLFLTTNRVGNFDDAMISRIHIVLHYEFEESTRQAVWDTFFRKLEQEHHGIRVPYSTREYTRHDKELRALEWNGRQIRNAFQTAVKLAEYRGQRDPTSGLIALTDEHFRQVVRMSGKFAKYMRGIHGLDVEGIAASRLDRNEPSKLRIMSD